MRTQDYTIRLKSRQFIPRADIQSGLAALAGLPAAERKHMLIQFERIPTPEMRETLKAAGVELLTYVPHKAWYASVSNEATMGDLSAASVRWMGEILQDDKISPALQERGPGPWAVNPDGTVNLHVLFFKDVDQQTASALLQEVGMVEAGPGLLNDYVVTGVDPDGGVDALAQEDIVMWVEEVPPPEKTMNDELRSRINADPVQEAPYSLDGTDVDVGIWDGGEVDATHDDFGSRVTVVETTPPVSEHATHVAGTLGGDGTLSASAGGSANQWRGVATNVDFFSYTYLYDDLEPEEHDGAINTHGIDLSQNSWGLNLGSGSTTFGDYTSRAVKYDSVVRGVYGRGVPVFFSAGNDRNDPGECDTGYNCITPPGGTSKNTVTVGAVNSDDDTMTDFSGWGPVDDGRIKPEVVAPGEEYIGGTGIQSTEPGDTYGEKQGTSMAAPAVSGTAALIIEQFRTSYAGNEPLPSTVKALLVHGAVDLDDGTSYYNPGPDYASGYGRIDTQASVDLVQDGKIWEDEISADDESDWYYVEVTSSSQPLKVTLAYDDPEGAVSADPALVNDLDLRVYYEGSSPNYYAWSLDPANPSNDATATTYNALDPLEQVVVDNPTPGKYHIRVWGWEVAEAPQKYSLVCEHFPFVSGDADPTLGSKIYWDEYHDTDGDTLSGEYSALAAAAASWGLTIDAKDTPITTADLSGYRLLVLPDPETALSADEVGAINSFIRSGGRLVILGEWYGPWENVTPMSAGHGITFNPDGVYDPTNNEGSDLWPHIRSFASHRLTAGLQTIALYASSSLYLHGSAIGLAGADPDAYTGEMNLANLTASQVGDNEFVKSKGAPEFIIAQDIAPNALLVMAYSQYGRGDIVAIGDSGLWSDGDPDTDGIISLEEFDNKQLAFNVLTTGSPISAIMLLLME